MAPRTWLDSDQGLRFPVTSDADFGVVALVIMLLEALILMLGA